MDWELTSGAKAVFEQLLDAQPEEREALIESCGGPDSALRREVEALLKSRDAPRATLEKSLPELLASLGSPALQRLRDYEVLRPIGHGGMGRVYLAKKADGLQQRVVAIKVINRAFLSSEVDVRFRRELNALSKLSHPNIVQLIDGGVTEDGLLYMAMEYVAGTPIDQHCRDGKLTERDKLQVFLQLCAAVSYAHRNLIVHRDLKPPNVLVTTEGTVKLLDFGVAKLLDEESAEHLTTAGFHRATVEYASPEQLSTRVPVSTTSDVYSLGVILYEILTGRLPYHYRGALVHEIVATILEDEPIRPKLSAELTSILLCALHKEPERRYASVDYLKDDIERYLDGQPVKAFRDSAWYRVRKFVRRRRKVVAGVTAAALAVVSASGAALYQAERANRRFAEVRELADEVLTEADALLWGVRGALDARLFVQKMAVRFLSQLVADSPGDEKVAQRLIYSLLIHAAYLSEPEGSHAGKTGEARKMVEQALALAERVATQNPKDGVNVDNLSLAHFYLGKNLGERGDPKGALAQFEHALKLQDEFYRSSQNVEAQENLALLLSHTGHRLALSGERVRSVAYQERALAIREASLAKAKENWVVLKRKRHLSEALELAGRAELALGRLQEALQTAHRGVALEKALYDVNRANINTRHLLAQRLRLEADVLGRLGLTEQAGASAAESVTILRSVVADETGSWGYRRSLGRSLGVLARIRLEQGRKAEAIAHFKEQCTITSEATKADPESVVAKDEFVASQATLQAAEGGFRP